MRIPLSWLAESVQLKDADPEAVLAALVRVGLEEEAVHQYEARGPIVAGEVLSRDPHLQTNGKTINWCQVCVAPEGQKAADGGEAVRGIICGAHNFEVGDKTVVTLPGSDLPGGFHISARKTYGHVSDGMMASARELGLGENHEGIVVLARLGLDPEPGTPLIPLLGLDDRAVEINVTPDRGYCFSIRGVAREYSHSTGADFVDPAQRVKVAANVEGFSVSVDDRAPIRGRNGVRSFATRVVTGIDPQAPTPAWMLSRLVLAGMRSVSLVVDVTNYVMLELGQPIHAYDRAHVSGGLVARRARKGERLRTLDGVDRLLDQEDLVIADDTDTALCLAGVMGGEASEVGAGTTDVLIEAACFEPISVARTARRHKLPSEASKRYERGVDPELAPVAAQRVVDLLTELAGATDTGVGSWVPEQKTPEHIALPWDAPERRIGIPYSTNEITSVLRQIGCEVSADERGCDVVPPSWRPDLTGPEDLIEEIARIVGYDRIPIRLPVAPPGHGLTFAQRSRRHVADGLANAGLTEVLSYPFVSTAENTWFENPSEPSVHLANPIDEANGWLRRLVLPGLLRVAQRNAARGFTDLALFEQGLVFRPTDLEALGVDELPVGAQLPDSQTLEKLYRSTGDQPHHVAAVFVGDQVLSSVDVESVAVDWRCGLDAARHIGHALGLALRVRQASVPGMHPGRAAELSVVLEEGELVVGFAGELHPDLIADLSLHGRVAVCELDLDALIARAPKLVHAHPLWTQTAATQDLSLLVPVSVPAEDVREAVATGCGDLLEQIRLIADYRGAGVPEGSRSLTFALRFRAPDRTLTAAEASVAKQAGVAVAAERFGAIERS